MVGEYEPAVLSDINASDRVLGKPFEHAGGVLQCSIVELVLVHQVGNRLRREIEGGGELANLVARFHLHPGGVIPMRQLPMATCQLMQGLEDAPANEPDQQQENYQLGNEQSNHLLLDTGIGPLCLQGDGRH
ncbi:hypothetical protein D3C84_671450 [compost metagenome]